MAKLFGLRFFDRKVVRTSLSMFRAIVTDMLVGSAIRLPVASSPRSRLVLGSGNVSISIPSSAVLPSATSAYFQLVAYSRLRVAFALFYDPVSTLWKLCLLFKRDCCHHPQERLCCEKREILAARVRSKYASRATS